ncbi:MAG: oligopeptide ABC transporter ATP-binding protein [Thermoprotei archaeon]|nr:MAG: oligopeptide ABC transporter ATP-binding protein [Thermoprotei archaeon]
MDEPLLKVINIKKYFEVGLIGSKRLIKAVDGVTFNVRRGETLGLVGESGCGKSTLGRVILRIYKPTSGKVFFNGVDITDMPERKLRRLRRRMQMIPQDPYASFNPLRSVGDALIEPLLIHGIASIEEAKRLALEMLERIGLVPAEEFFDRRPYQFSGGQLQRIAIARAMLLKPDLVVADEPTSSLDVSVRASILDLLKEFKERYNQALIFITHDLALAKLISDRLAVMYLGKIVEIGPTNELIEDPKHPYTLALLTAIPKIDDYKPKEEVILKGEVPDASKVPKGCRLHPRCPYAMGICRVKEPPMVKVGKDHYVACWRLLRK